MRYAHGVTISALLTLVIFLGAAIIKILALSWDIYVTWFFISILIAIVPPILIYIARRRIVREFLIYETGGFGLFSPLWLILFTDLSGDSWTTLFRDGIIGGLIGPGIGPSIVPIDIRSDFVLPILILCVIIGIIFLRPSFIAKHGVRGEMAEFRELKKSAEPEVKTKPQALEEGEESEEDPIEKEMPEVTPPLATADAMADLRGLLTELGTPEPTINLIFNSGIATTTELVATSPEQLASITGIDKRTAEDLHMAVQKRVWFGGI